MPLNGIEGWRLDLLFVGAIALVAALVGLALLALRRKSVTRAEAELEKFFSLSLDFLCISSADGYFKRVSPAVTDILGWSVKEFLARPFLELIHPEDQVATLHEVDRQVLAGEKIMHFENRYRHKDGSWRVLSWRSMPQPDGMMYATARDVTDLKRAEMALRDSKDRLESRVEQRTAELARANESLRRSERRFRALIEHSGDSIALVDADNRILYLSPAVTAVEGYTPEELQGQSGIENTHPDDRAKVQEIVQRMLENPGKPTPALWRRRHKDGRWLWLEGVATNLLHDPAVQGIVTNYRDVTERKHNEARLHSQLARLALLSQITRAIGERQDTGSIFQVVVRTIESELPVDFACICLYDPAAKELTVTSVGVNSMALAIELAMTERARVPIDANGLSQCVGGKLVHEPQIGLMPFPFPQRLARGGLSSMVAAPLRVESQVFGVLIVARKGASAFSSADCEFLGQASEHVALAAHQAQLHDALQKAYDDLRQTQQAILQQERLRALGQMASGIAHDINNAISPITLYTESLLEKEATLSPRAREQLQTIQRAIDDVGHTVARMREFYREREPQRSQTSVDASQLVRQVIDLTRARWSDMAHGRGIAIEVSTDLAVNLPLVSAAEGEVREALTNLVFNAVDAMPQGGTMTLRTRIADVPGHEPDAGVRRVCVDVTDTGIGMDEDTRRRCLEPFFTTKGERGTGLGLAMVYGAMQRHGAEITIESALGAGSTFTLSFPVPENPVHGAAASDATAAVTIPPAQRILIVDDDPVLLSSLRDILEGDAHTVTVSHGGKAGIEAFRDAQLAGTPFDVVITDLGMPHVDGRKVADAVKSLAPLTPVILLTGWGQRLMAEDDAPAGVDRIVSKPPRILDLREALAALTGR